MATPSITADVSRGALDRRERFSDEDHERELICREAMDCFDAERLARSIERARRASGSVSRAPHEVIELEGLMATSCVTMDGTTLRQTRRIALDAPSEWLPAGAERVRTLPGQAPSLAQEATRALERLARKSPNPRHAKAAVGRAGGLWVRIWAVVHGLQGQPRALRH